MLINNVHLKNKIFFKLVLSSLIMMVLEKNIVTQLGSIMKFLSQGYKQLYLQKISMAIVQIADLIIQLELTKKIDKMLSH